MIRRPPRSTQSRSSAASDVYKRQGKDETGDTTFCRGTQTAGDDGIVEFLTIYPGWYLSLIHISEPTRPY